MGHNVLMADFEKFLQELSFDEFEDFKSQIIISTMHKAKGKEFDIVFVGVGRNFKFDEPAEKRLLYVAFTRAKQQLFIHSQKDILCPLNTLFDECKIYDKKDEYPQKISYIMGLEDVYLDYQFAQNNIKNLKATIMAGDECVVKTENHQGVEYINILWENKCVARLSHKFKERLFQKINQGYKLLEKAKVQYIVKWHSKKNDEMTTQILCEISLTK